MLFSTRPFPTARGDGETSAVLVAETTVEVTGGLGLGVGATAAPPQAATVTAASATASERLTPAAPAATQSAAR